MNRAVRNRIFKLFVGLILVIFIILLIVNETGLFHKDRNYTFDEAVQLQTQKGVLNTKEDKGRFVNASGEDVAQAMKIKNQHQNISYMDISEEVPMDEAEVNQMLKGKGVLENKGDAFLKAQEKYDVNVIYLVSHALIETGHGRSELAKGIDYKGKTYYNFYGIGAFDEDAMKHGHSYAKKQKWTSPENAIMGGARFVRKEFFDRYQVSLYQMRWNPAHPGQHQYASDIGWDQNIARMMEHYYQKYGIKKDDVRKNFYK